MNVDPVTSILILAFCGIAAIGGTASIITYNRVAPWRESPIGRWYMGLLTVFTVGLYMLFISKAITGDVTRVVWVIISAGFAAAMNGNWWAIHTTQRNTNDAIAEQAARIAAARDTAEEDHAD